MKKNFTNYAFIDSQNLNIGIRELGWKLDFKKFRKYLREKYNVERAYLFIGYLVNNQSLYKSLQECGYVLIFKPVLITKNNFIKGNCDAELVLQTMIDYKHYDKAVVVTSDGDFHCLVKFLHEKNKLELVLSPCKNNCSVLLKKAGKEKVRFMNNLVQKLSFHTKKKYR